TSHGRMINRSLLIVLIRQLSSTTSPVDVNASSVPVSRPSIGAPASGTFYGKDEIACNTSTVAFVVIVDATKQLADRLKVAFCWAKLKFIRYLKSGNEAAGISHP
ncbi:hypothetical protein ACT3TP_18740, partial [Glutamicibacter sp. AOP38-B1-38]|uniref:hypothetical protein n=1 Tax=Glutamicibacter sp. AOP38-B1-38 TaxID=3457680 RepID=UPI00403425E9